MWYCFGSMKPSGFKGLCILVEIWHCGRPGEATVEYVMLLESNSQDLKYYGLNLRLDTIGRVLSS